MATTQILSQPDIASLMSGNPSNPNAGNVQYATPAQLAALGYTGASPTFNLLGGANGSGDQNNATGLQAFQQYLQDNGISLNTTYTGEGDNNYIDQYMQNGQAIGPTETHTNQNDDQFGIAIALASLLAGGAAVGAGAAGGAGGAAAADAGAAGGTLGAGGSVAGSAGANLAATDALGTTGLSSQIGAAAATNGGSAGGLFGTGFTGSQVVGGAGAASSIAGAAGDGEGTTPSYSGPGSAGAGGTQDTANTGSDAHLYQNSSSLGNMTDSPNTVPSWAYQTPGLAQAIQAGGSAVSQWITANPKLAAGLGTAALGSLTGSGSTNLNMPNFNSAAQSQQLSGMVNQTNPYGSSTYTQTGVDANGNPIYSQNTSLNTQGQTNLNSAQQAQGTALNNIYGNSADQAAAIQQAQQASYNKATSMLDPQWQQSGNALNTSLANQGIGIGSEAYNNAQTNYNNAKTTAYGQAQDSAIAAGNAEQNTLFGQNLQAANTLGGSVATPTFAAQPTQANYLGAAGLTGQGNINQYNATTGANNSLTSGLFSLGGSLLGNQNLTGAIGSGASSLFGSLFGSGSSSTSGTGP